MKQIFFHTTVSLFFTFPLWSSHFLLVEMENDLVVGQLLWHDGITDNVVIAAFLPLYDIGTQKRKNLPAVLPQTIIHPSCTDTTELISIGKVAIVHVCCIRKSSFAFLASNDVAEYIFHMQRMREAFLIQYKKCFLDSSLMELDNNTFLNFQTCIQSMNADTWPDAILFNWLSMPRVMLHPLPIWSKSRTIPQRFNQDDNISSLLCIFCWLSNSWRHQCYGGLPKRSWALHCTSCCTEW